MSSSRQQEKRLSGRMTTLEKSSASRRVPGSGNQWHSKGDVKSSGWLWECKRTDKASIQLRLVDLLKIEAEAIQVGRRAALELELGRRGYVVLPRGVFDELVERDALEEAEEGEGEE